MPTTTYDAEATVVRDDLSAQLAEELAARGIAMIDSPVSGGVDGAEAGTLTLMVGGEDAVIDRCLAILEPMAGNIFRTGAAGSGHALKTLNNLLSGLNTMAATEAMLIGTRFGLDPDTMVDVISKSTGMNGAIVRTMKQQVISRKVGGGCAEERKCSRSTASASSYRRNFAMQACSM